MPRPGVSGFARNMDWGLEVMNPAPSGTPGADLNPVTLLIVEDEVLVRMVIADSLRDEGFHVLEAANADEAVTLLGSFPEIALVFTDIQMPGSMDGAALARFVSENYPELPVIATSGSSMRPHADHVVQFVTKPYMPEDIARRVRELLDNDVTDPTGPGRLTR